MMVKVVVEDVAERLNLVENIPFESLPRSGDEIVMHEASYIVEAVQWSESTKYNQEGLFVPTLFVQSVMLRILKGYKNGN